MAPVEMARSHTEQTGAERLLRTLVRRGLAEAAVGRAATLIIGLDAEAALFAELGEERELHWCTHPGHDGERWRPVCEFYVRPSGRLASWCNECTARVVRERYRARARAAA